MTKAPDLLFDHVRAALLPHPEFEVAALARLSQRVDVDIEADLALPDHLANDAPRRAPVRRAWFPRSRVALVLAVLVVIATATLALAQSGRVRALFTAETPSAQRMQGLRITPRPSGVDAPAPDRAPADVERSFVQTAEHPDLPGATFGTLDPGDSTRTLLDGRFGTSTVAMYARRTLDDKVCYAVSVDQSLQATACVDAFFDLAAPINASGSESSGVVHQVFGIAADEVTGVSIELADGTRSRSLTGTNAFYWDDTATTSPPERIIIEFEDGRTATQPIER